MDLATAILFLAPPIVLSLARIARAPIILTFNFFIGLALIQAGLSASEDYTTWYGLFCILISGIDLVLLMISSGINSLTKRS